MIDNRIAGLVVALILFLVAVIWLPACVQPCYISIEIYSDNDINQICLGEEDIQAIGINERGAPSVEISANTRFGQMLADLSERNLGNKVLVKTETETVFEGIIAEAIVDGKLALSVSSEIEARSIIRKLRREPDYHLRFTPEEIERARSHLEPGKNPWHDKSFDARASGNYSEAVQYAKKAVESEPNDPFHYSWLSFLYYDQGQYELALGELVEAERLIKEEQMHKYPGIFLSLGNLYSKAGADEMAIQVYQKYLGPGNKDPRMRLDLAGAYERTGKSGLAMEEYVLLSESEDEYFRKEGLAGIERLRQH